jgi:hypothetical protein
MPKEERSRERGIDFNSGRDCMHVLSMWPFRPTMVIFLVALQDVRRQLGESGYFRNPLAE